MTSHFMKESRERDTSCGHPKNRRREHVDRRLERGPKVLNKYTQHRETNHRPIPPHGREITVLNVSIAEVPRALEDKNLL